MQKKKTIKKTKIQQNKKNVLLTRQKHLDKPSHNSFLGDATEGFLYNKNVLKKSFQHYCKQTFLSIFYAIQI